MPASDKLKEKTILLEAKLASLFPRYPGIKAELELFPFTFGNTRLEKALLTEILSHLSCSR